MPFCVDTSAWMDGRQRHYPPDVFPSLWLRLEERIAAGHIICSEEVYVELAKKADDLHKWIQGRKEMLLPLTEAVQAQAVQLLSQYPRLLTRFAIVRRRIPLWSLPPSSMVRWL